MLIFGDNYLTLKIRDTQNEIDKPFHRRQIGSSLIPPLAVRLQDDNIPDPDIFFYAPH